MGDGRCRGLRDCFFSVFHDGVESGGKLSVVST